MNGNSDKMGLDAIGIGSLNYDFTFKVDTLASGNQQVVIHETMFGPGGSAANAMYWLAHLGLRTGFLGAVGDDPEGSDIIDQMSKAGMVTEYVNILTSVNTSKVFVFVDKNGERAMYSLPGASTEISMNEKNINWLKNSKYVLISAIPGEKQFELINQMIQKIQNNSKIVFIPGALYVKLGYPKLKDIINRTHLLVLNQRELLVLTGKNISEGIKELLGHGCKIVVVTSGKDGCMVGGKSGIIQVPLRIPAPAPGLPNNMIRDTTGAGDAFTAGFVFGLLKNRELTSAATFGNIIAREVIQSLGARAGAADRNTLLSEFEKI